MIFVNWCGFFGGQCDMYNEVFKYGLYIVDVFVKFEQLVFIYILLFGEFCGGLWVVVDFIINLIVMEMYVDVDVCGGVLEFEGIIGIKYCKDKQFEIMVCFDFVYLGFKRQIVDMLFFKEEIDEIKKKMMECEQEFLFVYVQISLQFVDFYDCVGCMKVKGVICEVFEWCNVCCFFYWCVCRRLNEEYIFCCFVLVVVVLGVYNKNVVVVV